MTPPDPRILDLETPCILVERSRLAGNLARVRKIAEKAGVRLRPHVKTHKSLQLAQLQMGEGGACGITASKPDEALVFIQAGLSVTVAYPVLDARKLDRLLAASKAVGGELRFIADSLALVEALAAAAARCGKQPGVFMKVDVGLHRVGVRPGSDEAFAVAAAIHDSPVLDFRGLLSHAGHAYAASGAQEVAAIAEAERRTMLAMVADLGAQGVPVAEVSVGSTPTVLATRNLEGVTEIRPGNYVYLDATAERLGVAERQEVAMTVLVTVVSRNDVYLIVDAGSKVLSSDKGAHGTGGGDYGRAYVPDLGGEGWPVERLSEEHGWIAHDGADIPIGAQLRIVPNHSCPVVNLVGEVWVVEGARVLDRWEMQARARVQ